jgi:hypothetical protein
LLLRLPRIFKHSCFVDSSLESLLRVSKLFQSRNVSFGYLWLLFFDTIANRI